MISSVVDEKWSWGNQNRKPLFLMCLQSHEYFNIRLHPSLSCENPPWEMSVTIVSGSKLNTIITFFSYRFIGILYLYSIRDVIFICILMGVELVFCCSLQIIFRTYRTKWNCLNNTSYLCLFLLLVYLYASIIALTWKKESQDYNLLKTGWRNVYLFMQIINILFTKLTKYQNLIKHNKCDEECTNLFSKLGL